MFLLLILIVMMTSCKVHLWQDHVASALSRFEGFFFLHHSDYANGGIVLICTPKPEEAITEDSMHDKGRVLVQ